MCVNSGAVSGCSLHVRANRPIDPGQPVFLIAFCGGDKVLLGGGVYVGTTTLRQRDSMPNGSDGRFVGMINPGTAGWYFHVYAICATR